MRMCYFLALALLLAAAPAWANGNENGHENGNGHNHDGQGGGDGGDGGQALGVGIGVGKGGNAHAEGGKAHAASDSAAGVYSTLTISESYKATRRVASSASDLYASFDCQDYAGSGQTYAGGGAFSSTDEACVALREGLKHLETGIKLGSPTQMRRGLTLLDDAYQIRRGRIFKWTRRCGGFLPFVQPAPNTGMILGYRWAVSCFGGMAGPPTPTFGAAVLREIAAAPASAEVTPEGDAKSNSFDWSEPGRADFERSVSDRFSGDLAPPEATK